ncbi:hypothetical protein [Vitiosangium sp. GDMCC 1.1324]|uniref:hypothetical protein n=1 Tax=Vitiosangium sp. (strain GDMCC 1.1324) TaxID=2138576 RepID=UPI000D3844A3|nr:hypothetical protein [Vitiosangium sp. GDMCC 1.1324]PTL75378.1 hypothetical protein DAT35_55420 [Vitiosangium sp. GDMCC 1.1324]
MQISDFTIVSNCGPPPIEDLIRSAFIFMGPLVGIPLLLWLRGSTRDAQDVLGSALAPPAGIFRRLLDSTGWLLRVALALLLPARVTAWILASIFFNPEPTFPSVGVWSIEFSWPWIAAAVLVCSACFIRLLRTSASEHDVLRVGVQA